MTNNEPDRQRRLIRQERSGKTHLIDGAVVRSRGRRVAQTFCGAMVAGTTYEGREDEVICGACREASAVWLRGGFTGTEER